VLLLFPLPLPPPEQAATASAAATPPATPSVRSLTREELMNDLRDGEDARLVLALI
jgi:hypothetical protein